MDERRRWYRLALGVPVFVRGADVYRRSFTELGVAINISQGGALVALRHLTAVSDSLSLEIPTPPFPELEELATGTANSIQATIVRSELRNGSQLLALRFVTPIQADAGAAPSA